MDELGEGRGGLEVTDELARRPDHKLLKDDDTSGAQKTWIL